MFDTDRFIETCRHAAGESRPQQAIKELVARAVSAPSEVQRALGPVTEGGMQTLYHSPLRN